MSEDLDLSQFRDVFLSEAKENLQILNQSLVSLEKNPGDKENINAIFRVAHTLKGMAATMGFEKITQLSHHMENVLDKIRKNHLHAVPETVDVLFSCMDVLEKLLIGVETSKNRDVIDLNPLIGKLEAIGGGGDIVHSQKSLLETDESVALPRAGITSATPRNDEEAQWSADQEQRSAVAETIRVNVSHLDTLMNLVGEMVINRGRLEEISEKLNVPELDEALSFFERTGADLQTAVLKTRMVPVSRIFDRFPRMIRDVSRKLGKEVNLEISGADIEIDRMLLEQINEPLVHILRNAIDHGIEMPDARVESGKERAGNISLSARREQSSVLIEVKDDGKGMSVNNLKKLAVEKEILSRESAEKLNDKEALFLVCDPRFSTAKEITELSGRGVGMDVVKSAIESFNGALQIDSKNGAGSTFTIKLPLSLAIIRVLLVQVHSETYAIPLSNISEIVSVRSNEIETVDKNEVIVLRKKVLPLVRLDQVLGTICHSASLIHESSLSPKNQMSYANSEKPEIGNPQFLKVAVVEANEKRVGFVVTNLIGRREVVVKTLSGISRQSKGFSGATILGDGNVVLILDVGAWI